MDKIINTGTKKPRKFRKHSSLRKELHRFSKTTSMRGVPRIVNADSLTLKCTWAVAVLALLCFACFQVQQLISSYLSYEVYTSVQEFAFHPTKDKPVFPSLTICNENPFKMMSSDDVTVTFNEYFNNLSRITSCNWFGDLCQSLSTPEGFFQYLGPPRARKVSHSQEDFIISCHVLVLAGVYYDHVPCENLVNITLVQNVQYFNCFRLDITDDYFVSGGLVAGVKFVLHLANYEPNLRAKWYSKSKVNQLGAILTSHHYSMPAFPALDGIPLPPGASSHFHADIRQRVRLPHPHGICRQSQEYEGYEQMKQCVAECMNQLILARCGCVDTKLAVRIQPDTIFCLDATVFNQTQLYENMHCVATGKNILLMEGCVDQCPEACKEYQYHQDWSYAKWPGIHDLGHFYKLYISGKPYESHYRPYKSSMTSSCDSNHSCTDDRNQVYQLITRNFLEVSYVLSDHRYIRLSDIPTSHLADMCSKIGGVLNLWSGITVIVLLELFEMFCRLISFWGKSLRNGGESRDSVHKSRSRVALLNLKRQNSTVAEENL